MFNILTNNIIMENITLNGQDMSNYTFEHQIAAHFGEKWTKKYAKELIAKICPVTSIVSYKVINFGKIIIDTQDFKEACKYYDEI